MHGTDFWDTRYKATEYVFGTSPNEFLKEQAPRLGQGPVLCLAEGEGRNAAFLAALGHEVVAVDQSAVGLEKAKALATRQGVTIKTQVADLVDYPISPEAWTGIVSIFLHLPKTLRADLHRRVINGLRPGGLYILEAYTPAQLAYGTGGPKDPALLLSLSCLKNELSGLEWLIAQEIERDVVEGSGHTGRASVVQLVGRKP